MPAQPAAPAPLAPSATTVGSASARRLLTPEAARPLTLWGSSSMSSERGDESTPLPIRIHEHLRLAAAPAGVHPFGVGATRSPHTVLLRGLDTPRATPTGSPDPGTGAVTVTLAGGLRPAGPIRFPARLGEVAGTVDGSSGSWVFTPEDASARVVAGTLVSTLAAGLGDARQVLWTGKNNITETEQVLEDTDRLWESAPDTLVLGQWATEDDPRGSRTGEALAVVNEEQARRYGNRFVDVQTLLTGERGLDCTPLAPLHVLEQGSSQDAVDRGVVPPVLVAQDGIHLNGWGNLAVSWAVITRMRELRWL